MTKAKEQQTIAGELAKLEEIVAWFQNHEELDLEAGLAKVKEGATLVADLRKRLAQVENEFEEVKQALVDNE